VICVILHDGVGWPIYASADRVLTRRARPGAACGGPGVTWINHVRVPTVRDPVRRLGGALPGEAGEAGPGAPAGQTRFAGCCGRLSAQVAPAGPVGGGSAGVSAVSRESYPPTWRSSQSLSSFPISFHQMPVAPAGAPHDV